MPRSASRAPMMRSESPAARYSRTAEITKVEQ